MRRPSLHGCIHGVSETTMPACQTRRQFSSEPLSKFIKPARHTVRLAANYLQITRAPHTLSELSDPPLNRKPRFRQRQLTHPHPTRRIDRITDRRCRRMRIRTVADRGFDVQVVAARGHSHSRMTGPPEWAVGMSTHKSRAGKHLPNPSLRSTGVYRSVLAL